ncbi:MAG: ATP-binding protein [Oscillospiraceae bacterium]|jgi:DNA replication protein DnaC|nr:ATP-binding protein [Oscillospiraceae bacterium]
MGYSKEIYEKVQNKLFFLKSAAEKQTIKKRSSAFKLFPRLKSIHYEISSTSLKIAKIIASGNNTKENINKLKLNNEVLKKEWEEILKNANLPRDYLEVKYNCGVCEDGGFVNGVMCQCMRDMLKKECYNELNKLSPLSESTFENFSLKYYSDYQADGNSCSPREVMFSILKNCKNYVKTFNKNSCSLLMVGAAGLGKTHLSLAIANEIIKKGFGVIYGSTPNIVIKFEKSRFKANNQIINEEHLVDCDLLILDDLGVEFSTLFSNTILYNIINSRIMVNKPTIISTNLSLKQLENSYTERIVSRIMGNNMLFEFVGTDIRQKKFREKMGC